MTLGQIRIGTRGSPLARVQADEVRRRLIAANPDLGGAGGVEIVVIRTSGDRFVDRPLAEIGGKGLFTKEIDDALLENRIDLAVHSMKDVPTWLPDGLVIDCMLAREDPRDALIGRGSGGSGGLASLAPGAVVGTSSLRRAAQLLWRRPDLTITPLRGNVGTRMEKVRSGVVDATLLAHAGLRRLGQANAATAVLEPSQILPAIAQGAIGIECRARDHQLRDLLAQLNDPATATCVATERAFLARLDGSCRTPIAGLAVVDGSGGLNLRGLIAAPDGRVVHEDTSHGRSADATLIGTALAEHLLDRAGPDFLQAQ